MSKKCINCGAEIDDNARFCPECGIKQEEKDIDCPSCGTKLRAGSRFCSNCGTPISTSANTPINKKRDFEISQPDENTLSFNVLGVPFDMKFVKGGVMGKAELSDFYIGETVVTQSLWTAVMSDNPSKDISNLDFPVTNIEMREVKNFLVRLANITGVDFDIPTGTQFKYACEESDFEGDGDYLEVLNNRLKYRPKCMWGDGKLHPVMGMAVDQYGLYDLYDWPQLISDLAPADENYRILNPRHEEGEYYARKTTLGSIEQYEKPGKDTKSSNLYIAHYRLTNSDSSTLRLVINIPVDESVNQASKELEKLSSEAHERWAKQEIDNQLSLVRKYNTAQSSYTPQIYGGNVYINVEGDVIIKDEKITEIPINFGIISGNYVIAGCTSLEDLGNIELIGGNLDIRGTDIDEDELDDIKVGGKILIGDLKECKINGHEYVDLGLSVMWASCNIGASKIEEKGDRFIWGATEPSGSDLDPDKYVNSKLYGRYRYTGHPQELAPSDDAAVKQWGADWRMPTDEEMEELMEDCLWEYSEVNGVTGYKVINSEDNDNWIFLPGDIVYLWSCSLGQQKNDRLAIALRVNGKSDKECVLRNRYMAISIRPVIEDV